MVCSVSQPKLINIRSNESIGEIQAGLAYNDEVISEY